MEGKFTITDFIEFVRKNNHAIAIRIDIHGKYIITIPWLVNCTFKQGNKSVDTLLREVIKEIAEQRP